MTTKAFASGFARNATTDRWSRYAPLTGVVAVVPWIIGAYLLEKTDRPTSDALFAAWVGDAKTELVVVGLIFGFGVLFFLWFLGTLRATLIAAEGGSGRFSTLSFASGIAVAICLMFTYLPQPQAAFTLDELSGESVAALAHMGDTFFGGVALSLAIVALAFFGVIAGLPVWTLATSVVLT
jgi:hypothetical protein